MGDTATLTPAERRAELEGALALVARGNRDALRTVYTLTSHKLLGTIMHIVRERDAAEDVLQDVYLRVWHRAGRFDRTRASPITWLCTIARNAAIDAVRKHGRRAEVDDAALPEIADDAPRADTMLCDAEDAARLHQCLERLQSEHRKCIRMAFFRGYTHTELAEKLDVPLGTMKSWIRRGLASLKGCLGSA
ncbi:sigma-70 family RNA polymerase sigma factor [Erythrobacter arachoides]|uniref:RNA polymerase sigma factor n=1 Tax=Aurantiacibacter arachoides TaxID=1850444 RepID=A0A845A2G6_9SPHN|nr:sigma-70 family RNA polymerase sigma factor [Aurantiacibacter arachoides]MXO94335.1 sigma-70 family RNA polymerase sigma factor [Aurantiacibacter arachoides]